MHITEVRPRHVRFNDTIDAQCCEANVVVVVVLPVLPGIDVQSVSVSPFPRYNVLQRLEHLTARNRNKSYPIDFRGVEPSLQRYLASSSGLLMSHVHCSLSAVSGVQSVRLASQRLTRLPLCGTKDPSDLL